MAVIESPYKSRVIVKLNAGINPKSGTVITKNVPFTNVLRACDKDKLMGVVETLLPVLSYPFAGARRIEETTLEF